ncbi:MAG TPA: AbrB family transcriptional regulator [Clostridiales bacterium]|nr:AbrB family transcriptional regulator [Clostridiales bacterium]
MLTRIAKWGNGRGIRLSKSLLSSANLSDNDQVKVIVEKGRIIIEKTAKRHMTLEERMKGYEGKYEDELVDWNNPVGKEVW